MNKTVLLLNVGVLVVNFFLALTTTNSQIGLLHSAVETSHGRPARQMSAGHDASVTFLKVVQSVASSGSRGPDVFNATNLRALHDIVLDYRTTIQRGVGDILAQSGDGSALRDAYDRLGRTAREDMELQLAAHFSDPGLVKRLATEIIRHAG